MAYKDKEKQKEYQRKWQAARRAAVRIRVMEFMGGKCVRCSIDDFRVLQIDHIHPILRKDRTEFSSNLLLEIYRNPSKSKGLQLLCANCHMIKTTQEDMIKFGKSFIDLYNFNPVVGNIKPIVWGYSQLERH